MKHSDKNFFDDELNNEILAALQEPIADDDPDLLEFEAAMADWEQLQRENPVLADKIKQETEAGFEDLMLRMKAERLGEAVHDADLVAEMAEKEEEFGETCGEEESECKVVPLRSVTTAEPEIVPSGVSGDHPEYGSGTGIESETERHGKKLVGWRKRKKVFLIAAAVAVLGLGTTMMVQGDREYALKQYPKQSQRNVIANYNSALKTNRNSELKEAYREIAQFLEIETFELGDIPMEMLFEELILEIDYAALKFDFNGKAIYFEQRKVPDSREMSDVIISDRNECAKVYNEWLNREIAIEKNDLKNGATEYSAGFSESDVVCYLSGIMDEESFIDLVKSIHKSVD